jgi:hypothetical protein
MIPTRDGLTPAPGLINSARVCRLPEQRREIRMRSAKEGPAMGGSSMGRPGRGQASAHRVRSEWVLAQEDATSFPN